MVFLIQIISNYTFTSQARFCQLENGRTAGRMRKKATYCIQLSAVAGRNPRLHVATTNRLSNTGLPCISHQTKARPRPAEGCCATLPSAACLSKHSCGQSEARSFGHDSWASQALFWATPGASAKTDPLGTRSTNQPLAFWLGASLSARCSASCLSSYFAFSNAPSSDADRSITLPPQKLQVLVSSCRV